MPQPSWRRNVKPIHGAAVTAILKLIESQRLMTLATNRPDGWPQANTMGYINDGLNLYFVTGRDSSKLENLIADPRASVAIRGKAEEGEAVGLTLYGAVAEVTDENEVHRLNDRIATRYPDVSIYSPGGHAVAVLKFTPESVSAVAVVGARSQSQTFSIGDPQEAVRGVRVEPSAVARLF